MKTIMNGYCSKELYITVMSDLLWCLTWDSINNWLRVVWSDKARARVTDQMQSVIIISNAVELHALFWSQQRKKIE